MKKEKDYYGGVEEDYSTGALIGFFVIGMIILTITTVVLFNI